MIFIQKPSDLLIFLSFIKSSISLLCCLIINKTEFHFILTILDLFIVFFHSKRSDLSILTKSLSNLLFTNICSDSFHKQISLIFDTLKVFPHQIFSHFFRHSKANIKFIAFWIIFKIILIQIINSFLSIFLFFVCQKCKEPFIFIDLFLIDTF